MFHNHIAISAVQQRRADSTIPPLPSELREKATKTIEQFSFLFPRRRAREREGAMPRNVERRLLKETFDSLE